MVDENEFRKAKYEYDELREALPQELNNVMDRCYDLLAPFVSCIYPARGELTTALQKLQRKQFPEFNITTNPYLLRCIGDIISFEADMLATRVHSELCNIENGVDVMEDDDQFRHYIEQYARQREPRLETMEDYKQFTGFTYEEKVEMINESNAESIAACAEYNSLKSGFVEAVQPILFKYFGERFNELNSSGWDRYAVELGFSFVSYLQDFSSLGFHLKQGNLQGNPDMNFFDFRVHINSGLH